LNLDNEGVVDADSVADGPANHEDKGWIYINYGPTSRLRSGEFLADSHVAAAQLLLHHQFPNTKRLQNPLWITKSQIKIDHRLQIIHNRCNHWVLASNFRKRDNTVEIYDSVFSSVSANTWNIIK
uniref:Ubiquitin-like protease family profile domain-containing protein n=1 Tax=Amphimedon queenslandica TaxID=400682 RepID=A0A1X7VL18_AMPQE